jgi:hypothetical protein
VSTALSLCNSSSDAREEFPTDRVNWMRAWKINDLIPFLGHVGMENMSCTRPGMEEDYTRLEASFVVHFLYILNFVLWSVHFFLRVFNIRFLTMVWFFYSMPFSSTIRCKSWNLKTGSAMPFAPDLIITLNS